MTNEIIQAIKAEIERQQKENVNYDENGGFASYCDSSAWSALDSMLTFVSGLEESEKPMNQEGLEDEIDKSINGLDGCFTKINGVPEYHLVTDEELRKFASHFAQWGAEHLKK